MADQPATPKKSTWDRVGKVLASIARGAARLALWASQHPEVIQAVASIAAKA